MATDLPDLPQQAVDRALTATAKRLSLLGSPLGTIAASDISLDALDAAWPHLYAAALHHAAPRLECGPDCDMGEDCSFLAAANVLRMMADEATGG